MVQSIEDFCVAHGTTRADAEKWLKDNNEGQLYFESLGKKGQDPESLYFVVIAKEVGHKAENILEIGTGFGYHTRLFSKLYPDTTIYTMDIPVKDPDFSRAGIRDTEDRLKIFNEAIKLPNVKYIEKNSFHIFSMDLPAKFDFIYVDGGHEFPSCAWDIAYAYSRIKIGGYVFMHDYAGPGGVKIVCDYMSTGRVREDINLLPFADYRKGTRMAWYRKRDV